MSMFMPGARLSLPKPREMALAVRCAVLTSSTATGAAASAVSVHRLACRSPRHSAVWEGVLLPLGREEAAAAATVLEDVRCCEERSEVDGDGGDGGGSDAAGGAAREPQASPFCSMAFWVGAALIDADVASSADGVLRQGEMSLESHQLAVAPETTPPPTAGDAGGPAGDGGSGSMAAELAVALRRAGVRVVLARGHCDMRTRSTFADESVLLLSGVPPVVRDPP